MDRKIKSYLLMSVTVSTILALLFTAAIWFFVPVTYRGSVLFTQGRNYSLLPILNDLSRPESSTPKSNEAVAEEIRQNLSSRVGPIRGYIATVEIPPNSNNIKIIIQGASGEKIRELMEEQIARQISSQEELLDSRRRELADYRKINARLIKLYKSVLSFTPSNAIAERTLLMQEYLDVFNRDVMLEFAYEMNKAQTAPKHSEVVVQETRVYNTSRKSYILFVLFLSLFACLFFIFRPSCFERTVAGYN